MNIQSNRRILHSLDKGVVSHVKLPVVAVVLLVSVFLGTLTGFGANALSSNQQTTTKDSASDSKDTSTTVKAKAGIKDEKTFPDQAEGILREGGFEGEGSFHLERPGGKSQNAYLTSSTIDLSEFVGKEVKVWGATFRASKAGWLMDVGYLEVL